MDPAPNNNTSLFPTTPTAWRAALSELPDPAPGKPLPVFYFAHGSPMLVRGMNHPTIPQLEEFGPDSLHAQFLADFGTTLIDKYRPKGIVVFSAHWETDEPMLGM
jgi:aromatic ring-opening dioxygenase catalytic subunit (LigB family)